MKMQVFKIGTYIRSERQFIEMPNFLISVDDFIPYFEKEHNLKIKCYNEKFAIFQNDKREIIKIDMDDLKKFLTN